MYELTDTFTHGCVVIKNVIRRNVISAVFHFRLPFSYSFNATLFIPLCACAFAFVCVCAWVKLNCWRIFGVFLKRLLCE